ncbi:hypothetical protein EVAR_57902_1 [Eumeta japonica]|uniref:Uncharacterized protein n=1 Tax=Eumeta variegata TaxID=151549 RepID=A0A4C1YUR8_EUMVA|nr:hypothetical protein EVAR_57902_1 [Eumeta japonica]
MEAALQGPERGGGYPLIRVNAEGLNRDEVKEFLTYESEEEKKTTDKVANQRDGRERKSPFCVNVVFTVGGRRGFERDCASVLSLVKNKRISICRYAAKNITGLFSTPWSDKKITESLYENKSELLEGSKLSRSVNGYRHEAIYAEDKSAGCIYCVQGAVVSNVSTSTFRPDHAPIDASVSWDWKGVIHYELLLPGKIINLVNCQQLMRVKEEVEKKRREFMNKKVFTLASLLVQNSNRLPADSQLPQMQPLKLFPSWAPGGALKRTLDAPQLRFPL